MARSSEAQELDRLVTQNLSAALQFATRLTGTLDAAEDVLQEALVRVAQELEDLSERGGVSHVAVSDRDQRLPRSPGPGKTGRAQPSRRPGRSPQPRPGQRGANDRIGRADRRPGLGPAPSAARSDGAHRFRGLFADGRPPRSFPSPKPTCTRRLPSPANGCAGNWPPILSNADMNLGTGKLTAIRQALIRWISC